MIFTARDAATLDRLMAWRRDVRQFRLDPIDKVVIDTLRAAMDLSPSVGN